MESASGGVAANPSPLAPATASLEEKSASSLRESDETIGRLFLDFMAKVAEFDAMVDSTYQFLTKFNSELEYFMRPAISQSSVTVSEIIKSNYTKRMKSYIEADCILPHQNSQNLFQLTRCMQELQNYLVKAEALLAELQQTSTDAYDVALSADICAIQLLANDQEDSQVIEDTRILEGKELQLQRQEEHLASVMLYVYEMLKLDFTMQEKIIRSLDFSTSLECLENYCLMWKLRPYIDNEIMKSAWDRVKR